MKRAVKASAILLVILTMLASQAEASLIGVEITAKVKDVGDLFGQLGGAIHVDDIIHGMYTYESTKPDVNSLPFLGLYSYTSAPIGVTLSVNGLTFRTDPNHVNVSLQIVNNLGRDTYQLRSYTNIYDRGIPGIISWQLDDSTQTALSSDALPLTAPNLANWQSSELSINGIFFSIQADVISAKTVPEPSTTLLLGLALAGTLGYGWRQKYAA